MVYQIIRIYGHGTKFEDEVNKKLWELRGKVKSVNFVSYTTGHDGCFIQVDCINADRKKVMEKYE